MKEFLLLFRGGLNIAEAAPEEIQQAMQRWKEWMEALAKEGRNSGGQRLTPGGAVLRGKTKQVSDGPYTESKEIVGGYLLIKAKDFAEAMTLAEGCPIFHYDGICEVREVAAP